MAGSEVVADFGATLSCHVHTDTNKFADEGEVAWNVVSNCELVCCHKYSNMNACFLELRVQSARFEVTIHLYVCNNMYPQARRAQKLKAVLAEWF